MVSSALYRYFPSRDDLLTALIIDAYDALGAAAEDADRRPAARPRAAGWLAAACHAVRDWALAHPHEYALIYGSPVPGYRAPRGDHRPGGPGAARAFVGCSRDALAAASCRRRRPALAGRRLAGRRRARRSRPRRSPALADGRRRPAVPPDALVARGDRLDAAVRHDQLRAVRPVRRVVRAGRRPVRARGGAAGGVRGPGVSQRLPPRADTLTRVKLLVTGGAGYIGGVVTHALVDGGPPGGRARRPVDGVRGHHPGGR